jgi:hypothetical protein
MPLRPSKEPPGPYHRKVRLSFSPLSTKAKVSWTSRFGGRIKPLASITLRLPELGFEIACS